MSADPHRIVRFTLPCTRRKSCQDDDLMQSSLATRSRVSLGAEDFSTGFAKTDMLAGTLGRIFVDSMLRRFVRMTQSSLRYLQQRQGFDQAAGAEVEGERGKMEAPFRTNSLTRRRLAAGPDRENEA